LDTERFGRLAGFSSEISGSYYHRSLPELEDSSYFVL